MQTEQPIFTKERCIELAKDCLKGARYWRLKGCIESAAMNLNAASDWRRNAATYNL
ncbi:hypothetical protein [Colwellia sp. E2M01]|uniref:hypothetical protein n=1 Tax=Colwellia sp. E2M01 TaxID=2841561 RepID=UPI001C09E23D|nr:hypothetical protein [Colwellia sp. E2M01]MBU2871981.1 hypothetical protein [Colwellia sp. E2M01]